MGALDHALECYGHLCRSRGCCGRAFMHATTDPPQPGKNWTVQVKAMHSCCFSTVPLTRNPPVLRRGPLRGLRRPRQGRSGGRRASQARWPMRQLPRVGVALTVLRDGLPWGRGRRRACPPRQTTLTEASSHLRQCGTTRRKRATLVVCRGSSALSMRWPVRLAASVSGAFPSTH